MNWNRITFGRSHKGRQCSPMSAAEYAANGALLDNSDDSNVGFHLIQHHGKFMCPFDIAILRREHESLLARPRAREKDKTLQKMGFRKSGY